MMSDKPKHSITWIRRPFMRLQTPPDVASAVCGDLRVQNQPSVMYSSYLQ